MSVGRDMKRRRGVSPQEVRVRFPMKVTLLFMSGFLFVFTVVKLYEQFGGLY